MNFDFISTLDVWLCDNESIDFFDLFPYFTEPIELFSLVRCVAMGKNPQH